MRGIVSSVYGSRRQPINKMAATSICWEGHSKRQGKSTLKHKVKSSLKCSTNIPFPDRMKGARCRKDGTCGFCHRGGVSVRHAYCGKCGVRQIREGLVTHVPVDEVEALLLPGGECGFCHRGVLGEHNFCPWCGAMIVRKSIKTGRVLQRGVEQVE